MSTPTLHSLTVARIDEAICIGCALCVDACPYDAIVGAAKHMHTVLPTLCTGCKLCIPPCPVDCIAMVPAGRVWSREDARMADERKLARDLRIARTGAPVAAPASPDRERARRRAAIDAALARARARRATFGSGPAKAHAALKDDPDLAANEAPRLARLAALAHGEPLAPAKP